MATLSVSTGLDPHALSLNVRSARVAAVLNTASGGVAADAAERMTAVAAAHGVELEPRSVQPADIEGALRAAVAERPDVLIVLAGDGTLALAADICGPDGPLIVALPGGTMNMLPYALNGRRAWPEALGAVLEGGRVRDVSGGEVGGRSFYVAAILGAPARLADAREAMRQGRLWIAALRLRRALLRAFKGRLRFTLDGGVKRKAGALTLMCPLVSRGLDADVGLEAAVLDPKGALDVARLGLRALAGAWRDDPVVETLVCTAGEAWAHGRIPVVIDGEPHRVDSPVRFRFKPVGFRALVPADSPALRAFEPLADTGHRPTRHSPADLVENVG